MTKLDTTLELHEGVSGSGKTEYLVVTVKEGRWIWTERFETKEEAENWIRWNEES